MLSRLYNYLSIQHFYEHYFLFLLARQFLLILLLVLLIFLQKLFLLVLPLAPRLFLQAFLLIVKPLRSQYNYLLCISGNKSTVNS